MTKPFAIIGISLAHGKIVLSPEGAELLIKEIQQQLVK
ncbi:hypothetical protein QCQ72_005393 [Bacillus cereus]|nr:hypothetical protein [Bacillus cereus]